MSESGAGGPGAVPPHPASAATANAHAFVQRLIDLGLQHAVLSPGSRNAPIAITLAQAAELNLITLHVRIDEREAAFLALGLSKHSDIPALLCCTSGTAAVNFAPAVVEAFYAKVPLVVLTADRPEGAAARGASQSIEQTGLFAPHTVANLTIGTGADTVASADRARIAWNASRGPERGPAHVNFHLAEPLLAPSDVWPRLVPPQASDGTAAVVPAAAPAPHLQAAVPPLPALGARPLLVIGDVPHHDQSAVESSLAAAAQLGVPVLMEPTAGPRNAQVSIRHHSLVSDALAAGATSVLTVGRFGLGRHLRRLCQQAPVHVCFAAAGSGADPFATAEAVLPISAIGQVLHRDLTSDSLDPDWLAQWQAADTAAHRRLTETLDAWTGLPTGLHTASEVLRAARVTDALVFAAASRSIRDVDLVADFDGPQVLANLGVNGIDGLISSAAGVASATGRKVLLLIGDIAFLHGSNGLLTPRDESQPDLTVVVSDDNGGAIFSDLEQGAQEYSPWFERVFGTPHDRDLVAVARGCGIDAVLVQDINSLREQLNRESTGMRVVVVRTARRLESRDLRAALRKS